MRNQHHERNPSPGRNWSKHLLALFGTFAAITVALAVTRFERQPGNDAAAVVAISPRRAIGAILPRISPDGKRIAVSYQGSIWMLPVEGGTMTRLTTGAGFDVAPVWSPDGRRIAFVNSGSMYAGRLRVIDAASGADVKLPKPANVAGTIVYQKLEFDRDGTRILGVFRSGGRTFGLSWYDLKTGRLKLAAALKRWSRFALSNSGRRIAYTTTQNVDGQQGGNNGQAVDIWVTSAGKKPRKITRFPARVHDLCFSADDRSLFLVSELGGVHYDLWRISLTDPVRSRRKLTFGQADEHQPSVSRDGRLLVYTDNRENLTSLVVRSLKSGDERTLRISALDFREPTGRLRLSVLDARTHKPTTARVSIERADGKYFAPLGSLYRVLKSYGHFYCDGAAELPLPAGRYRLKAYRGPEYKVANREFRITAGGTQTMNLSLARWIHNAKRSWYSGENHIHANYGYGEWYNTPDTMRRQCAGEDLNVCNFMVANSDSDGVFDREHFRGRPDIRSTAETILYWNQEFRSTIWGHMTLVNLKQVVEPVFTGFKETTNPWDVPTNSDIADKTHLQDGLVNFTHVAQNPADPYKNPYTGKSIPVDAALGKIDSLDLNGSYTGTVPLWYRLLNCGFRLPASAGTDCFLNRINSRLPGGDRVYVRVPGGLTYAKWIAGLRAGRTFVTNGPMLELTAGGRNIGEVVQLGAAGSVSVKGKAVSQFPLSRVEVIHNGRVVAKGKLSLDRRTCTIDVRIETPTSGWIALRASGRPHPDAATSNLYAHTSPVYVDVKDKPLDARKDAAYFLKWIDRLSLAVRVRDRIPGEKNKQHVRAQLEAARAVYRRLLERK
jgi:WD40-like Beta Propeller Repeat